MAKFYGTNGVSHCLDEIIKTATERILPIDPYLKFSCRIQEELQRQDMLRHDIRSEAGGVRVVGAAQSSEPASERIATLSVAWMRTRT